MSERIKLAEAMGIDHKRFVAHGKRMAFDPFTDANDDYAVLEWMRSHEMAGKFKEALFCNGQIYGFNYKIGNNARAALKVLEDKEDE